MPRNMETTSEVKTFMNKDDYEVLKKAANEAGRSVADYLRDAIEAYMKRPLKEVKRGAKAREE